MTQMALRSLKKVPSFHLGDFDSNGFAGRGHDVSPLNGHGVSP